METFFKDLKHSARMLRQSPAFTITAIAALALGIGANAAIFSIVNAVLLKPVPFPEPARLVMLMNVDSGQVQGPAAAPAKFAHYQQQSSVIEQVSAFRYGAVNYTGGDLPEQLRSAQVSFEYFRCFGVPIIQGRGFSTEEDLPHGGNVVLLSEALWQRRFSGDPQILGKTIQLSAESFVVIGIVGETFNLCCNLSVGYRLLIVQSSIWIDT